ncbi:MAG: hypothetical protein ABIJ09_07795 [Pseudomonadota bacterium]
MSFGEHLQRVVREARGCVNCTLMAFDGITVETALGAVDAGPALVSDAHIEYSNLITQMRNAASGLDAGALREVCIRNDSLVTVLRPLNDEYLIAASFVAGGLVGKGRYLMRVISPRLLDELQ